LRGVLRQPTSLRRRHGRRALALAYHTTTLPLARWRLNRLAQTSRQGAGPLPPTLPHDAAARPTPQ
jgi:hypothetical protein